MWACPQSDKWHPHYSACGWDEGGVKRGTDPQLKTTMLAKLTLGDLRGGIRFTKNVAVILRGLWAKWGMPKVVANAIPCCTC